ncbi:nucleoside kinase [Helicovermis profundi]|uniref:Nucleoside kinase n=1 Tax=Helicovermis profundi TaxID=3065157 RepID=A0AAU9E0Z0_9FIRM|nr:nucleoside kinase [Clostridia bacterium S502]
MSKINISIGEKIEIVDRGIRLEVIADAHQKEDKPLIVAAIVNNKLRELTFRLENDSVIEFIDIKGLDGARIYRRSLTFVLLRAAMECFEDIRLTVEHSLNKGLYFEYKFERRLNQNDVDKIKQKMKEIIDNDEPIVKSQISKDKAKEIFNKYKMYPKVELLKYREYDYVNIYSLGWFKNYFYGYMVPFTGFLKVFDLKPYDSGLILLYPGRQLYDKLPEYVEQPHLASIYKESENWGEILGVEYVSNLNKSIEDETYGELMRISEGLHEKKVANIADIITESKKRLVLIAGPSSSGKTTFANRLKIQLKVNGLKPITLSTDDYFVDRENTPRDENGDYDFETIKSVDVDLFNKNLSDLLSGKEVELPTFNFKLGKREYLGNKLKIRKEQMIIIEGIHGLNEILTKAIDKKDKFKIYISALTQLNIDDHNRIPTTDTRLIRRIVRDSKSRGHSAETTIKLWPSVRRGEEKNIFPHQENADIMFNSALVYELGSLKKHAEPLLSAIEETSPAYSEAKRLLKFLGYFMSIDDDGLIPCTSILKEFVGGSCFNV